MSKYQIGEKYWLKVFIDPEEMEYLGEITTERYNGGMADIAFDVFRRDSFGRPDLIAVYNGKFVTRTFDNTVEGLVKAVGSIFTFVGQGYQTIKVGNIVLTIEEFKEQAKDLLTQKEIEEVILRGRYMTLSKYSKNKTNNYGEVKWCPDCKRIRQTGCSACGCGSCEACGYRWACLPPSQYNSQIIARYGVI
jgi:hypothetical protein